jgi:A/G-specific adenine glycosylase
MGARSDEHRKAAVRAIFHWYRRHGRTLPWRDIRNPYRILVAEIMLHQTQVSRVLQIFPRFLRRFPSLRALATGPQAEVVIAWRGMGYNNRAVRIHRLARQLCAYHGGKLPRTIRECLLLPGIGKYTAHALLVSVYRMNLPVVDVNIRRVFSRLFWRMKTTADLRPEKEVWALATTLVPRARGYDWTQALMDLGATVCIARVPKCPSCPIADLCCSRTAMKQSAGAVVRREPSFAGIPTRIYRGRIVEALRSSRAGLTMRQIGSGMVVNFSGIRMPWLRNLIRALERDGLVRVRGNLNRAGARILLA